MKIKERHRLCHAFQCRNLRLANLLVRLRLEYFNMDNLDILYYQTHRQKYLSDLERFHLKYIVIVKKGGWGKTVLHNSNHELLIF